MVQVNSEDTLIDYCRSRLGDPVIKINTASTQDIRCVADTIQLFREFHKDSTYQFYLTHTMTAEEASNGCITVSPDIQSITRLLPVNGFGGSGLIFSKNPFSNISYQFTLQSFQSGTGLFSPGGGGFLSYYSQYQQYIETLNFTFNENPQFDFARHDNKIYIHGKKDEIKAGDTIVADCQHTIVEDENGNSNIYNNIWVKDYCTMCVQEQWGRNISKYSGLTLPSGATIDGKALIEEATAEKIRLYELLRSTYELPPQGVFIG